MAIDRSLLLLSCPSSDKAEQLGLGSGVDTYQPPNPEGNFDVVVDPDSKRLQLLEPFKPWDGKDLEVPPHPCAVAYAKLVAVCRTATIVVRAARMVPWN